MSGKREPNGHGRYRLPWVASVAGAALGVAVAVVGIDVGSAIVRERPSGLGADQLILHLVPALWLAWILFGLLSAAGTLLARSRWPGPIADWGGDLLRWTDLMSVAGALSGLVGLGGAGLRVDQAPWAPVLLAVGVGCLAALVALLWRGRPPEGVAAVVQVGLAAALLLGTAWCVWIVQRQDRSTGWPEPTGEGRLVLLVTVDTLRADAIGAVRELLPTDHAVSRASTPQLDLLVGEGRVFTGARAPAPWTLPSLASLHTGVAPTVHGATDFFRAPAPELSTLAERFRRAGWRTAAVVSSPQLRRGGGGPRSEGLDPRGILMRGFERVRLFPRPGLRGTLTARWSRPEALPRDQPAPGTRRSLRSRWGTAVATHATTRELVELTLSAIGADVESQGSQFLWLHLLDPHLPYAPPWRLLEETESEDPAITEVASAVEVRELQRRWSESGGGSREQQRDRRRIRELYDAEVAYVDESLGWLFETLREAGRWQGATVVLASDHGEELWDHGGFEHGHTLQRELLSVPLVVRAPGIAPGLDRRPVTLASVYATLLGLAGVPTSAAGASVQTGGVAPPLPLGVVPSDGHSESRGGTASPAVFAGSVLPAEASAGFRASELDEGMSPSPRDFAAVTWLGWDGIVDRDGGWRFYAPDDPGQLRPRTPDQAVDVWARLEGALAEELIRRQELRDRLGLPDEPAGRVAVPPQVRRELEALGYAPPD